MTQEILVGAPDERSTFRRYTECLPNLLNVKSYLENFSVDESFEITPSLR